MALTIQTRDPKTGKLIPIGSGLSYDPYQPQAIGSFGQAMVAQPQDIVAPPRTTIEDAYGSLKKSGLLPTFTPIQAQNVSTIDPSSVGQIKGFGDDYYKNLADAATRRLQKQYFMDNNSLSAQLKNTMNKRGLIGSGIEAGGISDLYKNFGDELTNYQSQLDTQKSQNDLDTAKYNTTNLMDILKSNKDIETGNANRVGDYGFKNADTANKIAELGLTASSDEGKNSTDYATKMFQSKVDLAKGQQDEQTKILSTLNDLLNNPGVDTSFKNFIKSGIGKPGSILSNYFGGSYQDYVDRQAQNNKNNTPGPPTQPGTDQGQVQPGSDGRMYSWDLSLKRWIPV